METINSRVLVTRDTTANWNEVRSFIPKRGEIIVYTDHGHVNDGNGNTIDIPGIKIGDGNAYLIDLPFVGTDISQQIMHDLNQHTEDSSIHVSQQDRNFWNNKLNCQVDNECLLLTRQ
jgi:hypothetical protein